MFSKLLRPRTLVLIILLIIVAALTYGFAATLTPTTSDIAAGTSGQMNDMTATVAWDLNTSTPDSSPTANLTFTAGTPLTGEVYAQVQNAAGTVQQVSGADWVACTGSGPFACVFTGVSVENIYYIRIAAGE